MSDDRKLLSALLRTDRMALLAKAFAELSPHDKFEPGWHLEALMWQLERCLRGDTRRLLINMPPRSGKSIAASVVFVAIALGLNPKLRFLCASYSKELAIVFANQTRQIMNTAWYKKAFPGTRLHPRKNTETEFTTTAGGGRVTTSMGATLTGRGADFIILDDPHNADDVHSPTLRDRAERWFKESLLTRLNQKKTGVVIVVAQRLHEDDLCGRIIEDGGWTKLILPAVATETEIHWIGHRRRHRRRAGEVLQPNREPQETLDRVRESLGSARFEAMYQQAPVPAGGNMIKAAFLRYYADPPFDEGFVLQSWDCASSLEEERSYSVCTTWKVVGDNYFLLDVFRQRVEFPALLRHAKRLAERDIPDFILIEEAASGIPLAQTLRTVEGVRVLSVPAKYTKEARMEVNTPAFEAGKVWLPDDAAWLGEYQKEILSFPNGKYNDQVDSTSMALNHFRNRSWKSEGRQRRRRARRKSGSRMPQVPASRRPTDNASILRSWEAERWTPFS